MQIYVIFCFCQAMIPADSEELVLSSKCENSDSSLYKEHLLFSFIPSTLTRLLCLFCLAGSIAFPFGMRQRGRVV